VSTAFGWTFVRIAITAIVLAWVVRGVDAGAARAALAGFSWSAILFAVALVAIDRVLMIWRWLLLIRPMTSLPGTELTRIFLVSSFLGSLLPAGVGGDAARAYSVGRRTGQTGIAIASVVVDRWVGLLAVGVLGCAGILASIGQVPDAARTATLAATFMLLAGSAAGLFADRIVDGLMPAAWRHSWPGRMSTRLGAAIGAYRQHGGALMGVAALSIAVQTVRVILAWVLGRGLGIDLPFSDYWVFMPVNILVLLLPLSIGGFGLPQGTMIWTLAPLGVAATPAFLLSTLFVGAGIVGNIPGAVLYAAGTPPAPVNELE